MSVIEAPRTEPSRDPSLDQAPEVAFYVKEEDKLTREALTPVEAAAYERRREEIVDQIARLDIWDRAAARGSLRKHTEQASAQNALLRHILAEGRPDLVGRRLKESVQRHHPHEDPEQVRVSVEWWLSGIDATTRVVRGLKRSFASAAEEGAEQTIATNDRLDARAGIDLVEVVARDGEIERVCLIQVKSKEIALDDVEATHDQHEAFVQELAGQSTIERSLRSRALTSRARGELGSALEAAEVGSREDAAEREAAVDRMTERFRQLILELLTDDLGDEITDHAIDQALDASGSGIARAELAVLLREANAWTLFEHCAAIDGSDALTSWQAFRPTFEQLRAWARAYHPSLGELRDLTREHAAPRTALVRGQPMWSIVIHGAQVSTRRLTTPS